MCKPNVSLGTAESKKIIKCQVSPQSGEGSHVEKEAPRQRGQKSSEAMNVEKDHLDAVEDEDTFLEWRKRNEGDATLKWHLITDWSFHGIFTPPLPQPSLHTSLAYRILWPFSIIFRHKSSILSIIYNMASNEGNYSNFYIHRFNELDSWWDRPIICTKREVIQGPRPLWWKLWPLWKDLLYLLLRIRRFMTRRLVSFWAYMATTLTTRSLYTTRRLSCL